MANSLFEANQMYQTLLNYTNNVLFFPMDDFLTSEAIAISPELKINRLETLNELVKANKTIVVTNLMGYLRYLPLKQNYQNSIINLKTNMDYNINELIKKLYNNGYEREVLVNKTGDMATRGYVVDIFPISNKNPIRIEFWGDTIDSIREFDISTQLTIKNLEEVILLPATEFITEKDIEIDERKQKELIKYENITNITSYLDNPVVVYNNYNDITTGYELLSDEMFNYSKSLDIDTNKTYMNDFYMLNPKNAIMFNNFDTAINKISTKQYNSTSLPIFSSNLVDINKLLQKYLKGNIVILCVSNRYIANKILDEIPNSILTNENEIIDDKINIIIKKINSGFCINNYVIISENELFHQKSNTLSYKTNFKYGTKIRDINKLNIGDYVVHNIHGIGRYLGIKTLNKNGLKKDYLVVEYKDSDKLYIPVEKIELINKYSSNDGCTPKINKLGGTEWEKTKLRVKSKIENIAGELLSLYAKREATLGFKFDEDNAEQQNFEKEFPYEETIDQLRVTEEVKKDMEKNNPMDRLVCGDVGFGKTEIAFRAIFKAISSGKQVAFLCPTTILSNQHYNNALERFKSFPIRIEMLNRFVSPKKVKIILNDLKEGKIDLLIGTHRLLSSDVVYEDLGLLVVDEEQRFGVKHKEKIKEYKTNIDVLTLSATPIPRTLQMTMTGMRSISLLETAPTNRYPVQTYVLSENDQLIKDAIYKELSRGGQAFILFNHIDEMQSKVNHISKLVPDAKIISAHGQMSKTELEDVMFKFINKEYDVLLCTTIIETGIDIPSVNTLIIIDADRFGLSQLYQIRGRVGRSNKIAYCYLMYDKHKILSDVATKRLKAIKDFTELGSGLAIAMRDLAIRGAGDILGSEQAGFVDSVGIEMFSKMLKEEIARIKGEPIETATVSNEPLVNVETFVDDNYVSDEELKIEIHKKINSIDSYEKLNEVKQELEDRFGNLNEQLIIYMYEEWFEKLASELSIKNIRQTNNFIEITLNEETTNLVDGEKLFMDALSITKMIRFSMKYKRLIITLDTVKLDKHFIYYLIDIVNLIKKSLKSTK